MKPRYPLMNTTSGCASSASIRIIRNSQTHRMPHPIKDRLIGRSWPRRPISALPVMW